MEKSEDNLIAWIAANYPATDLPIGIGDDMAMLPRTDSGYLVTTDMLMDGVDFDTRIHKPEQIGWKSLAVGLSDCAAMAVRPRWALVSLALPDSWSMEMAQKLFEGMENVGVIFECKIAGGDTNSWTGPLVIDMTVVAEPWSYVEDFDWQVFSDKPIPPVRRDGMQSGDSIWVTGTLGGSIFGHHMKFLPRVRYARNIAVRYRDQLCAMMDISDGLSVDAARLARASRCGIEFAESALLEVASDAAREAAKQDGRSVLQHVLDDGEDFELLIAMRTPLHHIGEVFGVGNLGCTCVGTAIHESGVWLRRSDGAREAVLPRGWRHFTNK